MQCALHESAAGNIHLVFPSSLSRLSRPLVPGISQVCSTSQGMMRHQRTAGTMPLFPCFLLRYSSSGNHQCRCGAAGNVSPTLFPAVPCCDGKQGLSGRQLCQLAEQFQVGGAHMCAPWGQPGTAEGALCTTERLPRTGQAHFLARREVVFQCFASLASAL